MIDFTPLTRPYFARLYRRAASVATPDDTEKVQRAVLRHLLATARHTAIGREHGFSSLDSYEAFAGAVPTVEYEDMRPMVMRMVQGERDVLWPGVCRRFAQSSGTSGGKSKYIPVTDASLRRNHYAGSAIAVATYLHNNPASRIFSGKSFILGGSFANELADVPAGVRIGDLSASLIDNITPFAELFRVPSKKIALMENWERKVEELAHCTAIESITNISGVPSWFHTILRHILRITGKENIHQVWPSLEVFFHGGIAFEPYREQYRAITDPARMHYHENYNASEGFFATQESPDGKGMRLLTDIGTFYEFIPLESLGSSDPKAVPAWQVEKGRVYALAISSCNGLWRYIIGDTVRIESTKPLLITIAGRTNSYINAFGEELMVWNADTAIARACAKTGASVANYTAAPVYASCGKKGHHQWLIEWAVAPHQGTDEFAEVLDRELQAVNSDYQAKRSADIFLALPEVTTLAPGTFDRWLASTGKLGGQRKIPRLANDRRFADPILTFSSVKS